MQEKWKKKTCLPTETNTFFLVVSFASEHCPVFLMEGEGVAIHPERLLQTEETSFLSVTL